VCSILLTAYDKDIITKIFGSDVDKAPSDLAAWRLLGSKITGNEQNTEILDPFSEIRE
jgi:hypothetical protein